MIWGERGTLPSPCTPYVVPVWIVWGGMSFKCQSISNIKASLISKHLFHPLYWHCIFPCPVPHPAPDMGWLCPHKLSSLVESVYINPRNFPEWPKKNSPEASDSGHTCLLLTRVVARRGDTQMLFGFPLPKFVVSTPPELKAAKMDTPDGGLLCQGCWDLLNRLDVCVHPGINRAAALKPARRGWFMGWERNGDGERPTAVGQGRRGLGWEEAARLHFILLHGSGAAEPSAESRHTRRNRSSSRNSSCAEVGEAALHSPRTAWAVVGLCCSSQNFSLNKPNLSNLKAAGIHQPSQRQCVLGPNGTFAWGFILQESLVPSWVKILGSLLHKASLICFWGCLKQGQGSLWNNSTHPAVPVCDG